MSYQEAMNKLADLEEFFYYLMINPGDLGEMYSSVQEMHHNTKALLEKWHRMTGCKTE